MRGLKDQIKLSTRVRTAFILLIIIGMIASISVPTGAQNLQKNNDNSIINGSIAVGSYQINNESESPRPIYPNTITSSVTSNYVLLDTPLSPEFIEFQNNATYRELLMNEPGAYPYGA
jgi:hypothetical protein